MKRLLACFAVISLLISLAGCRSELANAIVLNDIEAVKTLIAGGADVNEKSPENFSPLHWAAEHGRTEIARLLIDKGADMNLRSGNYGTPLMVAAYRGHKDMVKLLLEKGANAAVTDAYGKTALNYAREYQFAEIVRMLDKHTPPPGAVKAAPAGEQGIPGSTVLAKKAPGGATEETVRQFNMAVFTFESVNIEANPYGVEIARRLENRLETIHYIKLIGRRDLEKYLVINELQQNNDPENINRIGTKLGLHYIISGKVEKQGAVISAECRLISIEENKIALQRVIQVDSDANLAQELEKFGTSVTETLSRQP